MVFNYNSITVNYYQLKIADVRIINDVCFSISKIYTLTGFERNIFKPGMDS